MKTIQLGNGFETVVDDCDYDCPPGNWVHSIGYARSGKAVRLHRVIALRMGLDIDGLEVDHVDGNPLNNQRRNLRTATHSQNLANRGRPKNNTSGFKGVSWSAQNKKWHSYTSHKGKRYNMGFYPTALEAAVARDLKTIDLFGEFARVSGLTVQPPTDPRGFWENNTSGYRGVIWDKARAKWRAYIKVFGKGVHLGRFDDKIEAAKAYNTAAIKHFGERAYQNPL